MEKPRYEPSGTSTDKLRKESTKEQTNTLVTLSPRPTSEQHEQFQSTKGGETYFEGERRSFGKAPHQVYKHFCYVTKRHLFNQIRTGAWAKPFHFLKVYIKHCWFGYPYLALIETTTTCNIRCPACPTPYEQLGRHKAMMSLDDYKKILDNIKDRVHVVLLFHTNEPLLHPKLADMARYAHENNLYTMISTNATLLDKKRTNELLDSELDEIILCLDGVTKESYEKFRRGATFEKVYENIKYFCEEKKRRGLIKPFTELQFILNRLNQDQIPQIQKIAAEWQVDHLHIRPFNLGEYAYSKGEIRKLSEEFLPTTPEFSDKIIYERNPDGTLKPKLERKPNWKCTPAYNQCVVLVDGSWAMCCYDIQGKYVYGNLLKQDFREIWFDKNNKRRREVARRGGFALCQVCEEYE